jgi:hypothetical protein
VTGIKRAEASCISCVIGADVRVEETAQRRRRAGWQAARARMFAALAACKHCKVRLAAGLLPAAWPRPPPSAAPGDQPEPNRTTKGNTMGSNSGQKVTIGGITFNQGLPPGARVINGTVTHHADGTETA